MVIYLQYINLSSQSIEDYSDNLEEITLIFTNFIFSFYCKAFLFLVRSFIQEDTLLEDSVFSSSSLICDALKRDLQMEGARLINWIFKMD